MWAVDPHSKQRAPHGLATSGVCGSGRTVGSGDRTVGGGGRTVGGGGRTVGGGDRTVGGGGRPGAVAAAPLGIGGNGPGDRPCSNICMRAAGIR